MLTPFNLPEPLEEILYRDGQVVFRSAWDSGGPGAGADVEMVLRWQGVYWVRDSDQGIIGPYETLEQCLYNHELLTAITSATTEINCVELPKTKLRKFLSIYLEEPFIQFEWNCETARAHQSGRITVARKASNRGHVSSDCSCNLEQVQAAVGPGFLWSTYFRRVESAKQVLPTFEMDRSSIKILPIDFDNPVQSISEAVLSYLERENLPTRTLVERANPSTSAISYLFLDGGVELEFVTDTSDYRYNSMKILGFDSFRWLMYFLRLSQPRRLHGESRIPMHYDLESRFKKTTIRALRTL
jgi:hypothetical protein